MTDSKTPPEFTTAGKCTKTNSPTRRRSKTIASPADNVRLVVSVGKKEIFSAVGHTATGKVRRRKEKGGRHPRFFQATVTSARGREMEPRDKGGGSITLRHTTPRATCYDELVECNRRRWRG